MTPFKPQSGPPKLDRRRYQFSLSELIVVITIVAIVLAMLLPVINSAREADRRAKCLNKTRQIGLAFQNYASTFNNSFPASASLTKTPGASTLTVGGWSFLVRLLPFLGYDSLYRTLPRNGDPEDTSNQAIVAVTTKQMDEFLCPSWSRTAAQPQTACITNYKAMGATTRGSLVMAVNPLATPPYGCVSIHPDGAIFPGNGTRAADILDGQSHTIFIIETMDEAASRWTVGKEATLVGMPQSSSATDTSQQPGCGYYAPPGFDNTWGPDSAVSKAGLRTFLSYDFSPTGADAGTYEDPGFGKTPAAYGPSSMHPGVVVCGMGDGSTQAISKQTDAANLFFLITKNNSDPFDSIQ